MTSSLAEVEVALQKDVRHAILHSYKTATGCLYIAHDPFSCTMFWDTKLVSFISEEAQHSCAIQGCEKRMHNLCFQHYYAGAPGVPVGDAPEAFYCPDHFPEKTFPRHPRPTDQFFFAHGTAGFLQRGKCLQRIINFMALFVIVV
jgi:hypothetical protein